uniref:Ig-like domain-containing protein n=1 Tax=Phasianus colchicus TaxID=9054 RepID=A0A669P2U0_PHACC
MCVLAPSAGSCSRSSLLKRNGLCTAVAPLPRTACHLQSRSVVISALSRGFLPGSGRLRKGAMLPSGHEAELQQSQGPVVVIKGEMLTLNCTVSKSGPVGPVNWLKNQSNVNQTIYDQKGSSQRVMRAVNGSETDFTIHIRDVRLEDAGTYYCVKFRRNTSGDEVFKSGGGTKVLVHGEWIPSLLHEPEKSSGATTTQSDPNNLTYADLNFAKEKKKSTRRIIELSQQSEYACIQGSNSSSSQPAASSDNLTYADLDMVHLSKAPRRPTPHPEESSSEYASVQIQRQ